MNRVNFTSNVILKFSDDTYIERRFFGRNKKDLRIESESYVSLIQSLFKFDKTSIVNSSITITID